jgi:hypothetical protein
MGWSAHRKTGLTYHQPALSCKGYTLLAPVAGDSAYLLDMDGRIVQRWRTPGFRPFMVRLLPTGKLLALCSDASLPPPTPPPNFDQPPAPFTERIRRMGGAGTNVLELDWDGTVAWNYRNEAIHHDCQRLANGNTLVAEWVELPAELDRQVKGGARRPKEKFPPLVSDDLIEVDAAGKEVARLHLWQMLDPVRDPICPLEARQEWTHLNSLDLLPNGDILFSCRNNSRVGIIDRAAGKLRWQVGPPHIYHQHHATALRNGNVQIFDNGMHRVGLPFSRVIEINPADDTLAWNYTAEPPEQFFSGHISGADRQANSNVLITEGSSGRVFEVTQRGEVVWEWINPFMYPIAGSTRPWLFRAYRYSADFPGLAGRELDPARYAELNRLHGL